MGAALLASVLGLLLALLSWSVDDPSLNHATQGRVHNLLGALGAIISDLVMQLFGIASLLGIVPPFLWGWTLLRRRGLGNPGTRVGLWLLGMMAAAALASFLPAPDRWPLPTGLGGVIGDFVLGLPARLIGFSRLWNFVWALLLMGGAITALSASSGVGLMKLASEEEVPTRDLAPLRAQKTASNPYSDGEEDEGEPGFAIVSVGAIIHPS